MNNMRNRMLWVRFPDHFMVFGTTYTMFFTNEREVCLNDQVNQVRIEYIEVVW